jgi:hypothetical protein
MTETQGASGTTIDQRHDQQSGDERGMNERPLSVFWGMLKLAKFFDHEKERTNHQTKWSNPF